MKQLFVLYDGTCAFCERCTRWLEGHAQLVPLVFIRRDSDAAQSLVARLSAPMGPDELILISDDGDVFRGDQAWVMCLWALRDYRTWAHRLASPAALPLARRAFKLLSSKRHALSRLLGSGRSVAQLESMMTEGADANESTVCNVCTRTEHDACDS